MIVFYICLQAVIFSKIFLEITDVQVVHWRPFFYVHDRFQITLFFLNRVVQRQPATKFHQRWVFCHTVHQARLQIKCALKRGTLRGKFLITCSAKNYVMSACDIFQIIIYPTLVSISRQVQIFQLWSFLFKMPQQSSEIDFHQSDFNFLHAGFFFLFFVRFQHFHFLKMVATLLLLVSVM